MSEPSLHQIRIGTKLVEGDCVVSLAQLGSELFRLSQHPQAAQESAADLLSRVGRQLYLTALHEEDRSAQLVVDLAEQMLRDEA